MFHLHSGHHGRPLQQVRDAARSELVSPLPDLVPGYTVT